MWVIRKISPWQERDKFYSKGNPVIFAGTDKDVVFYKKRELEVEELWSNPLPNLWEYWDVDRSKEMIKLNTYLIEKHNFPILNKIPDDKSYYLELDDIKHGLYPDKRFTNADLLQMQDFIEIYYFKMIEIIEVGKYLLVADPYVCAGFIEDIEFKIFETKQEGEAYLNEIGIEDGLEIVEII